ncbi:bacteriophage abortive infection AbiH family protein [Prevotella intermedia]|uniref:bacteriophage abortive infection AbiH family protein n=1 Tax=Prevotella intermedia TaxID=28131 RepID=UPI0021D17C7E|nr:bacteriophage abortive infection AbiH family protein [Prevotella intermedia]
MEDVRYNHEKQNKLIPERIMLLSFNYTATAKMYGNFNVEHNYIHGELERPENIILGYGDELDKDYQDILDRNDNELFKNVKSVKYLETRHYQNMLEFLMAAPFQVLIMGHSCGNSDRTLLNTVFEHENCISITPFYHKWDDGTDNYLELV